MCSIKSDSLRQLSEPLSTVNSIRFIRSLCPLGRFAYMATWISVIKSPKRVKSLFRQVAYLEDAKIPSLSLFLHRHAQFRVVWWQVSWTWEQCLRQIVLPVQEDTCSQRQGLFDCFATKQASRFSIFVVWHSFVAMRTLCQRCSVTNHCFPCGWMPKSPHFEHCFHPMVGMTAWPLYVWSIYASVGERNDQTQDRSVEVEEWWREVIQSEGLKKAIGALSTLHPNKIGNWDY